MGEFTQGSYYFMISPFIFINSQDISEEFNEIISGFRFRLNAEQAKALAAVRNGNLPYVDFDLQEVYNSAEGRWIVYKQISKDVTGFDYQYIHRLIKLPTHARVMRIENDVHPFFYVKNPSVLQVA